MLFYFLRFKYGSNSTVRVLSQTECLGEQLTVYCHCLCLCACVCVCVGGSLCMLGGFLLCFSGVCVSEEVLLGYLSLCGAHHMP